MVKHSAAAAKALAYLKRPYNDIDIFVEDTGNHNMWLTIIRRIIPNRIKVTSVNLLGGRDSVIKACKRDQIDNGRRKLYIIDGDFDFILGRKKVALRYLYRIRAYCIENLLLNEETAINLGVFYKPTWNEAKIRAELQFEDALSLAYERLAPLFQMYALAYSVDPTIKTVGNSVEMFYLNVNDTIEICRRKVFRMALKIARRIRVSIGYLEFVQRLSVIRRRASTVRRDCWISGKDYILPLFRIIFRKRLSASCDSEQLKVLLANKWMDHMEPGLSRRLQLICA
jgi:hypothetical protein